MEEFGKKLKAKIEDEESWFPGKKLGELLSKSKEKKESKGRTESESLEKSNSLQQGKDSEKEQAKDKLAESSEKSTEAKKELTTSLSMSASSTTSMGSALAIFSSSTEPTISKSSELDTSKDTRDWRKFASEGSDQIAGFFKGKEEKKTQDALRESDFDAGVRKIIDKLRPDGAGQENVSDILKPLPKLIKGNVVGQLTVIIYEGKQVDYSFLNPNESAALRVPRGYYAKVRLEDREECTDTALKDGSVVWHKNSFTFDVTDVSSDLSVFLFRKRPLKNDKLVGQIIIPLPLVYQPEEYNFTSTQWYELYPHVYGRQKHIPALDYIDDTGIERPKVTRGFIKLKVDLKLPEQIYYTYLKSSALVVVNEEKEKVDITVLKMHGTRLKNWFTTPPVWVEGLMKVGKAEYPISSLVIAWMCLFFVCFISPTWLYPMLIAMIIAWLSLMSKGRTKYEHRVWKDEVHPEQDTVPQKMMKAMKMMPTIQRIMGTIASVVERLTNSLNWSDPVVSTMMLIAISVISVFFSFLMLLGTHHILHYLVFIGGSVFLFKPYVDKQRGVVKSEGSHPLVNQMLTYLKNFAQKVPDNMEIAHRRIAARQVTKTAP